MTIYDANGNAVFSGVAHDGETISTTLFLGPGAYTFRFVGGTRTGDPLPPITFWWTRMRRARNQKRTTFAMPFRSRTRWRFEPAITAI
jgi:hypothetical protein